MERYSMFPDWKNQYCENDYTTKCNLHIRWDPYQINNGIFPRTRTKNFTIRMETQMILNSQSNLEKEEWSWKKSSFLTSDHTTKLQSSRQYGTGTKKYRSMEQNRKPRDKSTHLIFEHLIFDKGGKNIQWRKDNLFIKWCWGNLSTTWQVWRMKLEHFLTP